MNSIKYHVEDHERVSGPQELVNVLFKLITILFSSFPHCRCESRPHQCSIRGVKFFPFLDLVLTQ